MSANVNGGKNGGGRNVGRGGGRNVGRGDVIVI
jgi:hypothetical protein